MKRSIFYTFLTQLPTLLLYFAASTVMTRMLGDVGRGEYALLNNQVVLFTMLASFNIGLGITFFTAKGSSDLRDSIGTASTVLLLTTAALPILLWALSNSSVITRVLMPDTRSQWPYWAYVYASITLGLVNSSVAAVLLGMKKFKVLNGMAILNAVLSAAGFSVLYLFRHSISIENRLPAVLIVSLVVMVVQTSSWCLLYAVHVKLPPIPVWSWAVIRPILTFSLIGYLNNLINLVNYRFDVWVVDQYHGPAALGLYAVAVGMGQLLFYVPDPFSRVVQPFLFGQKKDEMLSRYKAVNRLNFTTLLLAGLAMGLTAPWILSILFGDVFKDSAPALQLLLPGILFSGATKMLSQLVVQRGQQSFSLLATAIGAAFTIALDLLLIPIWGIKGAALASTLSYLLILSVILLVIRYRIGIAVHDMFLLRRSDLTLLSAIPRWK